MELARDGARAKNGYLLQDFALALAEATGGDLDVQVKLAYSILHYGGEPRVDGRLVLEPPGEERSDALHVAVEVTARSRWSGKEKE